MLGCSRARRRAGLPSACARDGRGDGNPRGVIRKGKFSNLQILSSNSCVWATGHAEGCSSASTVPMGINGDTDGSKAEALADDATASIGDAAAFVVPTGLNTPSTPMGSSVGDGGREAMALMGDAGASMGDAATSSTARNSGAALQALRYWLSL